MASPVRSILPRLEPTASPRQPAASSSGSPPTPTSPAPPPPASPSAASPPTPTSSAATAPATRPCSSASSAPHPNAPLARALDSTAGFSFDYHVNDADSFAWPDLAVCDPLSRQYLLLPRMPEDLLACVPIKERNIRDLDASLVPSGDWEETSFTVLRTIHSRTKLVVFVFSSISGCWSVGASTSFFVPPVQPLLGRPQFAYGCCYWQVRYVNKLLKLNMNTTEFSTVDLPDHERRSIAIVEAGEGNLGMFAVIYDIECTSVDYYIFMQNLSGRSMNAYEEYDTSA
ncbi:hypothetical protein BAE44_0014287 [Dichanthelium oligosanthes]|uniref:Uncharacterized protein n=1 Tax=Dichanthelium oligosanthes TaxID=888268 RepID=A0A1E5VHT4_9POAL|nr:hypothetical protein BAE44_0014287 [Dichanthelium oligosanthes]